MIVWIKGKHFDHKRFTATNDLVYDSYVPKPMESIRITSIVSLYVRLLNDNEYDYLRVCQEYLDPESFDKYQQQYSQLPF
jgi:hypothetical protein